MSAETSTQRISHIELDESSIIRRNADIEHERRVAIFDLLEDNLFAPLGDLEGGYAGPYNLVLHMQDNRLVFDIGTDDGTPLTSITLPLTPFKKIIKEYFLICDSYYTAIKSASPRQIEAIDMGRRGLHNEGSELLMERLADKVELDMDTARRLFTLICVLQIR
ncbi:UPF0262 family protein [Emcibacter nanhaiensis]|uniref:UPF0262 protein FIV46_13665 n=1 Tax=Emcibacter nanhaiensis TaxID=1505037 RepID=A0A501PFG5_9PROT|nr:UPF0262 family protein [Emcibacter nanhaiensis]TPD58925.1 UPF0262 family protein [Emcibacter nanhaiensis]